MYVKQRGNLFDVFSGKGWDSYSLFQIKNGKILFVDGMPLSSEDFTDLVKKVKSVK